ncbi:MAG: AAA family ATPase [Magnetococcales bacterium]|nr:AAA family ATPase [Magnetococcales bacterium]
MTFEIKPAVRIFQPVLISFWGGSSSGKTYSALLLARGLVGPHGKIGVIDTENRRALFYAGKVGGQWDHLDFQPPFTPERYVEAFKTFENAGGYNCVIIDSASHVWEGEGGILDQADKSTTIGLSKWAKPKMALKRMINTLLRSGCHVIFCLRAKMGVAQDGRGRDAKIYSSGLEPIMEKNLIFEMTVSILFGPDHKPLFQSAGERYFVNPIIPAIKAPEEILKAIRPGEYITEATGKAIADWLNSASRDVPGEARRVAGRGYAAFKGWWPTLTPEEKASLQDIVPELREIATKADEAAMAEDEDPLVDAGGYHDDAPTADDGQNDALSNGFESVLAHEPELPPAFQPQATAQPPAAQTTIPLATTATPVRLPPAQATAQPPATQTAQSAQRAATQRSASAASAVTSPPRRASAASAKPTAQTADPSAPNLF